MIYLDGNATTKCDPRVVEKMLPYFTENFGNPSSHMHDAGKKARTAVENARSTISKFIGAKDNEIIFTSGATESNNLALLGISKAINVSVRNTILTTSIEHKSILEPCNYLKKNYLNIIVLKVDKNGLIIEEVFEKAINERIFLFSVQLANNEIGTIQNIKMISKIAKKVGAFVHCDAAQALGKIKVDVNELGVDFLSMSAHKMYGPKGIGALYIKEGTCYFPGEPLFFGGGQEFFLRPGTLNVPGIVGFGEACRIASLEMDVESGKIKILRDYFEEKITSLIPGSVINGDKGKRVPGTASITFPSIESEVIISNAPELMISSGSACTTELYEPSHVLKAIGLSDDQAFSTIRFTIGRFNTLEEIDRTIEIITDICKRRSG